MRGAGQCGNIQVAPGFPFSSHVVLESAAATAPERREGGRKTDTDGRGKAKGQHAYFHTKPAPSRVLRRRHIGNKGHVSAFWTYGAHLDKFRDLKMCFHLFDIAPQVKKTASATCPTVTTAAASLAQLRPPCSRGRAFRGGRLSLLPWPPPVIAWQRQSLHEIWLFLPCRHRTPLLFSSF